MISINKIETFGFEAAIRGCRNPMNSWDKSDSKFYNVDNLCVKDWHLIGTFNIGPNDLKLMQSLIRAGTDHSKFMRMINVTMDITAPLYWWKEFDTYKVGTTANSCSTMHKIHGKEFSLDDFSHEHLTKEFLDNLKSTISALNKSREAYNWCNTDAKKEWWWQMIQLLPSSYNQKRTVQLNYQVLRNIYLSRRNHRLDEWINFCRIIEELPYGKELICLEDK